MTVSAVPGDVELLGKTVEDLQEEISVSDGDITGTLKFVTGYEGYSEEADEQEGNYLALHIDTESGAEATVELDGVEKEADEDGNVVIRVADNTETLTVTTTFLGVEQSEEFDISGLTLEEE